jgi:hypothetical protein
VARPGDEFVLIKPIKTVVSYRYDGLGRPVRAIVWTLNPGTTIRCLDEVHSVRRGFRLGRIGIRLYHAQFRGVLSASAESTAFEETAIPAEERLQPWYEGYAVWFEAWDIGERLKPKS